MTPKKAAEIMRDVAEAYAEDFAHMDDIADTIKQDKRELLSIAGLLDLGEIKKAAHAVYMLDTLVRDYVPSEVYHWLCTED